MSRIEKIEKSLRIYADWLRCETVRLSAIPLLEGESIEQRKRCRVVLRDAKTTFEMLIWGLVDLRSDSKQTHLERGLYKMAREWEGL